MLSRLNQRLFFTSYKGYALKLPATISAKPRDLNLTITPQEIKQWVLEGGERFYPVEGGKGETLASLAAEQVSGAYISHKRGLVGWWIPKKRNIYECRIPARQFALDADLIIGAIWNSSGIFVLGRERIVPVDVLPPLRFETLALLADVQDGQKGMLAQSYERLHEFAGPLGDGKDWAPILLSSQLRDTEYGSLLNITDQLLKGWSNNGLTHYHEFYYPQPADWPPFPVPLPDFLKAGGVTYNWNTKGAGYVVNFGSSAVMALNRSGALPVSYIPEGSGRGEPAVIDAEERGYNYFSKISDPNLVRVVQYAGMYQIFSAFSIARSAAPVAADPYPSQLIESLCNQLKNELRAASTSQLDEISHQIAELMLNAKASGESGGRETTALQQNMRLQIDARLKKAGLKPGTKEYDDTLQLMLDQFKKVVVEKINQTLAQFNLKSPPRNLAERSIRELTLSYYASLRKMPQRYAQTIESRATKWIHTSPVVISWNEGGLEGSTGGHNLNARVSKIVLDEAIPAGEVKIGPTGNLLINPKDLPRARGLARTVERNDLIRELAIAETSHDPSKVISVRMEMQKALNRAEVVSVRPREIALHLSSESSPIKPSNKPPMSTGESTAAGGAGWGGRGRSSTTLPIPEEGRNPSVIRIAFGSDGRFNVESKLVGGKEAFELSALTHEDAVDVAVWQAIRRAKPGESVVIEFTGIPEHKALATLRTMEIRMRVQAERVELIGLTHGENLRPTQTLISKQYDFARSTVEASEIKTLPTGELRQDVSVNVPAYENSGEPVSFSSEITFNKRTPRNVVSAITEQVYRTFEGIATRWKRIPTSIKYQADVNAYNAELAMAVKKIKVRTKLDFDVKTKLNFSVRGKGDIYISQRERNDEEPTSISAACQSE